ncbi:hypothetical protein LEMLEM_LOCUS26169, partial [Lemmus lemmus]
NGCAISAIPSPEEQGRIVPSAWLMLATTLASHLGYSTGIHDLPPGTGFEPAHSTS